MKSFNRIIKTGITIMWGLLVLLVFSCKQQKKEEIPDVSHFPVNVQAERFEQLYAKVTPGSFPGLKEKYPFFFPDTKSDSIWLTYPKDSLWQALYRQTDSIYRDFSSYEKAIGEVFSRVKYYYPTFQPPKVITVISLLDMDFQVIYADSLMLLSLDTFLGRNAAFYSRFPEYLREKYRPSRIPVAVANAIAKETMPRVPYRRFIDRMIAAGKLQYAVHLFVPETTEAELFRYSPDKMQWARDNEAHIWAYFIDNEFLYSTDKDLVKRFLDEAPFSKFYKAFDNESPGRIGEWIGYHIVQSYMRNNEITLPELMATPPDTIWKKSKYKPDK